MKIIKIIIQVIILYVFSMLGNFLQTFFHLPISGSIIGLFLLLGALLLKILPVQAIKHGSEFLLLFLTLFFVPATIGIMKHPSLFSGQGALVIIVVVLSTIITMIVVGRTSQFIESKVQKRNEEKG
jgi:holin-like protein